MKKLVADLGDIELMLDVNKQTILKDRAGIRACHRLVGMPEPFATRPRLLWWLADIEAWAESRRTFRPVVEAAEAVPVDVATPSTPKNRKRGRPKHTEKARGV